MIAYQSLQALLADIPELRDWRQSLPVMLGQRLSSERHGDWSRWQSALADLPVIDSSRMDLNSAVITVESAEGIDVAMHEALNRVLQVFHPWRKGPYRIHGIEIDTEWRSDWKWDRLVPHIQPLHGRRILDVGCGNGYHGWRMLGAGARWVIGIDPTLLNVMQYHVIWHFTGEQPIHVLPLAIEEMPDDLRAFDTVFSMGVLYHQRSPLDHLLKLRGCLRQGGELVLETLVIEGGSGQVLLPEGRYAQMRNVWFIPSPPALLTWLQRCGFRNARWVDLCKTSTQEQRSTPWMRFQSLVDFLDPNNPDLTVEGLPAPRRAIFIAEA